MTQSILVVLIYIVVMLACAWTAFDAHAWMLGVLALVGAAVALRGAMRLVHMRDRAP